MGTTREAALDPTSETERETSTVVREATRFAHNSRSDVAADWFATGALLYAALLFAVSIIRPFRIYFDQPDDIVSESTLIIDPNIVFASLVLVIAIGLRRRLAEAWWLGLVLILLLPTLGRVLALAAEDATAWAKWVGLVVNIALIALAIRAKGQFRAHNAKGADLRALGVLLVGGAFTVVVGGWLANRYGTGGEAGVASVFGLETILQDMGAVQPDQGLSVPFWVRAVVNLLGAAVVLGAAYVWFRSPRTPGPWTPRARPACARCCASSAPWTRWVLRHPSGQGRRLGHRLRRRRPGRRVLPRRGQRCPGERQPHR